MAQKKSQRLEDQLATVVFHVDKEAHITVKKELCLECDKKPCLAVCPAGNYTWDEEENQLIFNFEGCLECGTCKFICSLDAIVWSYPRGGFGVSYSWG